ncbi:MAG: GtrA family protein [Oscillospiraceae bacterium]|nr:GtrA family protein [Oscillospiraceae bacterium]
MIEKIKALCIKHREILVYLIVGGLTTVVSWAAKFIWNFAFYAGTAYPTVVQNFILSVVNWVAGVAFAYPMNRRFVFQSKNPDILKEAGGFVMSRVATLILDIVMMQVLVLLGMNVYIATVIVAVLVIVGNYVFSKFLVFNKK